MVVFTAAFIVGMMQIMGLAVATAGLGLAAANTVAANQPSPNFTTPCYMDEDSSDNNHETLIKNYCNDRDAEWTGGKNDCGGWRFQGECVYFNDPTPPAATTVEQPLPVVTDPSPNTFGGIVVDRLRKNPVMAIVTLLLFIIIALLFYLIVNFFINAK